MREQTFVVVVSDGMLWMDQKEFEEIMTNAIDGYLSEMEEKNLPTDARSLRRELLEISLALPDDVAHMPFGLSNCKIEFLKRLAEEKAAKMIRG